MSASIYPGVELDLFREAVRWKAYWASHIRPFVQGDVVEVGAGIGANIVPLFSKRVHRWLCLEPDQALGARIKAGQRAITGRCEIITGTLHDLDAEERFDTILYLDVLEHIEDDRSELAHAAQRLRSGGRLLVLAPAHAWLYTPFDAAVGHHRRYNKSSLLAIVPTNLTCEKLIYLDSVGLLASLGNRVFLHRSLPTVREIRLWDGLFVPCSRRVDPWLGYTVGKSLLGVWRREPA